MARFVVTWQVEYETDWRPETEADVLHAVEMLFEECPGDVTFADPDGDGATRATAIGWRVEHPEWDDMAQGTLADMAPDASPSQ